MKKEDVARLLDRGYLISPDIFETANFDESGFIEDFSARVSTKERPLVLNKDLYNAFNQGSNVVDINWYEFEKSRVYHEKGKDEKIYGTFLDLLNYNVDNKKTKKLNAILKEVETPETKLEVETPEASSTSVIVVKSYKDKTKKRELNDFVQYFKNRYEAIRKILQSRQEMQEVTSINRVLSKTTREETSIIGLVYSKSKTKNGNLLLSLEDPTGKISVLISQNYPELMQLGEDICEDEVIGIKGFYGNEIIFANQIIFPDIMNQEIKKSEDEVYAAFISDLQIGSELCLINDLKKFVSWLNGEVGDSSQRKIATKVKYLIMAGDIIDGVGIYPKQDQDLAVKDVVQQYELCAEIFSKVRKDIQMIVCPGNHDSLRLAEPQPAFNNYAKSFTSLPNLTVVSNPGVVNIHASENFKGFDILLYHGYSFHHYMENVESVRNSFNGQNVDAIMKFLLKKRHLAPTHGSAQIIPDPEEDALVIDKIPDIFVSGHMHKASVGSYNGVINICCGCWQDQTSMQEKYGIQPDKSKVVLFNLKSRQVKMLSFNEEEK
ncbi:MAG: metallophosphoesterase [Candidatus Nanoarchaeia archaeon]|nr:metallophosphoesterase [Candidatus Nanoarchaeia archaeon]